jgi:hypothetical protein
LKANPSSHLQLLYSFPFEILSMLEEEKKMRKKKKSKKLKMLS